MEERRGWVTVLVVILGIFAVFVLAALAMVWVVRDTVQSAVAPVGDVTGLIGTQAAELFQRTPTIVPNPNTIISDIRNLARLETIQYTAEKVITAETGQGTFGFLFGDRLLFVAHGQVIAGVDLRKLGPEDLHAEDGVLYVRLPEPEIFVATLDNDQSYVYDRETGVLTEGDINLESEARRVAEAEILGAAVEDGILTKAQENAESFLYQMLRSVGYVEVIFVDEDAESSFPLTRTPVLIPTITPEP